MDRYLRKFPYNEKGKCHWCGKPVGKGRRTWCGQACVDEWQIRSGTTTRSRVFARDRGVCAGCGVSTELVRLELQELMAAVWAAREADEDRYRVCVSFFVNRRCRDRYHEYHVRCDRLGLPWRLRDLQRSLWEADHIQPVAEGGGGCGLDNLRTLCWRCHACETRELQGRLAGRCQLELRG